jgi:hypothetical protein
VRTESFKFRTTLKYRYAGKKEEGKMRKAIPIVIGVLLLLVGIGWASQGAGIMGGSSLMDNNSTFIYLGGFMAIVGVVLVAYGATSKAKPQVSSPAAAM